MISISYFKNCGSSLGRCALYTAAGAASGATGAKVMNLTTDGGYHPLETAQAGAAGGAIMGASIAVLEAIYVLYKINQDEVDFDHFKKIVAEITLSWGTITLSGMLGHAILNNFADMTLGETALAMGVGYSTLLSTLIGVAAAGLLIGRELKSTSLSNYINGAIGIPSTPGNVADLDDTFATLTNNSPAPVRGRWYRLFHTSNNQLETALLGVDSTANTNRHV